MKSKFYIQSALTMPLLLVMMLFLAGCQQTLTTRTAETERAIAGDVCSVWVPRTYSSRDTEETQLEVRANNAARNAYCMENEP